MPYGSARDVARGMTADPVYVDLFSYALGEEEESLEEAARAGRTVSSVESLREAGFRQHRVCGAGASVYDLARWAVEPIRDRLGEVDAIVYSACIPLNGAIDHAAEFAATCDVRHLMDFPASRLQSEFGLTRATVIGLDQQACTGMLGSIRLARALLLAETDVHRVLCVTADRFPPGATYEQTYNLISDGAGCCVVSDAPAGFRVLGCHAVTNGGLVMASADETVGSFFTYAHRTINAALAKAGVGLADIAYVVPQNTNPKAWALLARLLGLPGERVWMPSIGEVGHVISADNVVNLARLEQSGRLRPGDRVLLFMAGYGMHWQCTVLERV